MRSEVHATTKRHLGDCELPELITGTFTLEVRDIDQHSSAAARERVALRGGQFRRCHRRVRGVLEATRLLVVSARRESADQAGRLPLR